MMAKPISVASIHTSFNINRNPNEAHTGDVTLNEQIKAMTRFVRWHERQVEVGRKLLSQLVARIPKEVAAPETPSDAATV